MSMQQDKLDEALKELISIVIREKITLDFAMPTEDPQNDYGCFDASGRSITIFKERTDPITPFHIYAFAHEIKHYIQYSTLDGYESWLYALGVYHKDNQIESSRLEMDADDFAVSFLKRYKIRVPKSLKAFIEDRRAHYT